MIWWCFLPSVGLLFCWAFSLSLPLSFLSNSRDSQDSRVEFVVPLADTLCRIPPNNMEICRVRKQWSKVTLQKTAMESLKLVSKAGWKSGVIWNQSLRMCNLAQSCAILCICSKILRLRLQFIVSAYAEWSHRMGSHTSRMTLAPGTKETFSHHALVH